MGGEENVGGGIVYTNYEQLENGRGEWFEIKWHQQTRKLKLKLAGWLSARQVRVMAIIFLWLVEFALVVDIKR